MMSAASRRARPQGGNRLRVLRAERRLTQYDVYTAAKLTMWTYWTIEVGRRIPSDPERKAIAKALGVGVAEAFPDQAAA